MPVNRVTEVRMQFAHTREVHPGGPLYFKVGRDDFLNVYCKVTLDLSLIHLFRCHEFVVVGNLTLIVLIGCDLMYRFNVVIDFVNRSASFMGSRCGQTTYLIK